MGPVRVRLAAAAGTVLLLLLAGLQIGKLLMEQTTAGVLPVPESIQSVPGVRFTITGATRILVNGDGAAGIGAYLAALLRPATGYDLPVAAGSADGAGHLRLRLDQTLTDGYTLDVGADAVLIRAPTAEGLFHGVQTLRQLLAAAVESDHIGQLAIDGVRIVDRPRFAYRGVMLDVARHFFPVSAVKRLIDLAALYKLNHLHLHLTDDQGWRIAINAWPQLTVIGAATEVGGGPGGFYTAQDYREIVEYAAARFIVVVPEIDLPGHTNAALAAYPELNCDGHARAPYTGIDVGFSALCPDKEFTYTFLDAVFAELAALTPGEYVHIGGDECPTLPAEEYAAIVQRAQDIVAAHGKTVIGWQEIAAAKLLPSTVVQFWGVTPDAPEVVAAGNRVIMSPANRTYLDMKYDGDTRLGLSWAGYISVRESYDWDPVTYLDGVQVIGVESPLWTETVSTVEDIEYLAFPRLAATAELGWSPAASHDWAAFRQRLAAQAYRWKALGMHFHRASGVDWPV
jgi:hexosaminidase